MRYALALILVLLTSLAHAQIPQAGIDFTRNACTDRGAPIDCSQYITTTRALGTFCTSAAGVMTSVGVNTACITSAGLEVWEGRTNYNLQSNTFTDAGWTKSSSTVTAAAALAPDGTMTATKLTENSLNAGHYLRRVPDTGINAGTAVFSLYLKAAGRTAVGLLGSPRGIAIDLTTCTAQSMVPLGTALPNGAYGAASLANGWCRLWFADTTAIQAGVLIELMTGFASGNANYLGDGTSGVYVWQVGAQLGAFPTPPITTTTATVTRPADVHVASDRLATVLASATGSVSFTVNGSQAAVAATLVDANGTVVLGKTAGNLATTGLGATLSTANTATWTAINDAGLAWDAAGGIAQLNGGTVATDAVARTPAGPFRIGSTGGTAAFWNGNITRLSAFSSKLATPGRILDLAPIQIAAVPSLTPQQVTLSWPSTYGEVVSVDRWQDSGTPTSIGTSGTGGFTDSAVPAVNTVYSYRISRAVRGASVSATALAAISDMTKPFVCPLIPDVAANLLGVDRTESFNAPDGTTVAFTIRAPIAANMTTVSVPQCTTCTPGVSDDRANIMAQVASGKKVQLSAGDYIIDPGTNAYGLLGLSLTDFALVGAGRSGGVPLTRLHLKRGTGTALPKGIQFGGNRILLKDFSIDWDILCDSGGTCHGGNAIPGTISTIDSVTQRFTVQNPSYYVPDPTKPPDLRAVNNYLLTNRAWDLRQGGRVGFDGTFNPNFAVDGLYYYTLAGSRGYYADGGGAVGFVRTSVGIQLGAGGSDYSVEGVSIFGGGGPGIIIGSDGIGFRLSNFQITRKPDALLVSGEQPRLASVFGDSDANSTQGSILIENSEFGWVGDDWFYNRGAAIALQTLTSTSSFTLTTTGGNPGSGIAGHNLTGDALQFVDPNTLAIIGGVTVPATWDPQRDNGDGTWSRTAHFPAIPGLSPYIGLPAVQLPIVYEMPYSGPNLIVRNSCFHDGPSRLLLKSQNFLIDGNTFGNGYYSMIELSSDPEMLKEGPNPSNGIIRNNKMFGNGGGDLNAITGTSAGYYHSQGLGGGIVVYGIGGYNQNKGFIPGAVNNAVSAPYKNIWITDNLISFTQGVGMSVNGVGNGLIARNTIVNANTQPFTAGFGATYCGAASQGYQSAGSNQPWCLPKVAGQGSLMTTWSSDVVISGNRFLGTSIGGIFVAPNNTPWPRGILTMLH
jgi:hypothetical protein